MTIDKYRPQSPKEELYNGSSHVIGVIFCLVAMPFLLMKSLQHSMLEFYSMIIYALGMLLVYTSSSSYHFAIEPKLKTKLKIADHISIYFLIAGTYTPLMIKYLDLCTATIFLGVMWFIVFIGSILKLFYTNRFEIVSILLYLMLGWMLVFVIKPLIVTIPSLVFTWITIGGLSYTIGVYFYVNGYKKYYHFV